MIYHLHRTLELKTDLPSAWSFFSNPGNLPSITPPWLGFTIASDPGNKIYPGQIIRYKVRPIANIPTTWITEITHVEEPRFFVDEQRYGPYKIWHHQHIFSETDRGVRVDDIVDYVMPFSILGTFVHKFYVSRLVNGIFDYRNEELKRRFDE